MLGLSLARAGPAYAAPPGQDDAAKAQAQSSLQEGITLSERGDLSGALDKFLAALSLFRDIGDRVSEAQTLGRIGAAYVAMEQFPQAIPYLEQALIIRRQLGDQAGEAITLGNLGTAHYNLAQYEHALDYYRQALDIVEAESNPVNQATLLSAVGTVYTAIGQFQQALDYYRQALTIQQQINDRIGEANTLSELGAVYLEMGQLRQALTQLEQALSIQRQVDDRPGEAFTLNKIGAVYAAMGQPQQALEYYQQALPLQRQVGGQRGEAVILGQIGAIYENIGQFQQALTCFEQALVLQRQVDDRAGEGETLVGLGAIYQNLGQHDQALEHYQQALEIARAIGDVAGEGERLNSIGTIYSAIGQPRQALGYYQQALEIQRRVDDRIGETETLNNIGASHLALSDYPRALDYLQQAQAAYNELGDSRSEADTLVNIGTIYYELARPQEALAQFQQALPLFRQISNRSGEANTLSHIGGIHQELLGQLPRALDYYEQALAIYREIGTRQGEAQQLNNIGYIYEGLNQFEQALEMYQQSLAIFREVGDSWGEATTLDNIGGIYSGLGQLQQALTYYHQALALRQAIGDRAGVVKTLNKLGLLSQQRLGQTQSGVEYFQQALTIARDIGDRQGEAIILENIGNTYLDLGQQIEALAYFRRSIEIFESIRRGMSIEELKSGFIARYADVYQTIIPLLIELARPEEAFTYVERARARVFLDQLGNVRVTPHQGADPALVEAEQKLAGEISALDRRQRELLSQPSDPPTDQLIADLQARLTDKRAEYADLLIQLKLSNPVYANLISVDPLTLTQIQTEVLAENTVLISYFVTAEQTIAFVIKQDNFVAVPIPITRLSLTERVTAFRSLITLEPNSPTTRLATDRQSAAQALYALLLAPLSSYLPTTTTTPDGPHTPWPAVIIAPHDILHYLPFAALADEARVPLSARFTLSLIPSASALSYAQANQSPDQSRLLALGNPTTELPPLPYAEHEVENLAKLYPQRTTLLGSDATEVAFRAEASKADWIHLAAHSQLNPTSPLFSVLYLAAEPPGISRSDTEQTPSTTENLTAATGDGRLEVHEILNLDLTGVNGVVLSACETGLGEQSRGDELVGLTRAFLYAGTPVVVASLWEVEDEATAVLMTAFHQRLRTGLGPAAALRAAQVEIQQNTRWAAPYYWAGFQAIGAGGPAAEETHDVETIVETTTPQGRQPEKIHLIWLSLGFALLLALFALASRIAWRRRGW